MPKYLKAVAILMMISFIVYIYWFLNGREEVSKINDYLVNQNNLEEEILEDLEESNYSYNNPRVILNPYGNSPLTALIIFKTDTKEVIKLTVTGKDNYTTITHTFDASNEHIIPVYGLYPDSSNKVIISGNNFEKEITIKTEKLPDDFILPTSVSSNKDKVNSDLIFVTPAAKGYVAAYDVNGDVRWYLQGTYAWDIQRLSNGHILIGSNRLINTPYYTVGLMEMDLSGKIYKEYDLPGGYHHDAYEMPDGNFLVTTNNFNNGTVEDEIVLLNRKTGKIDKSWSLKEILPMNQGKSENWIEYDWFHNNSVWYDMKTNAIILSGRHQDVVISIDYDTNKLNWIIGDSTNWSDAMKKYFFTPVGADFEWQWSQHAAMVLPNGNIFLFDNGNNRSKIKESYVKADDNYSRGVIYNINTNDMTIRQVWQYGKNLGNNFYSPYISDVDYFDENHYLIHSGGISSNEGISLNVPGVTVQGATLASITKEILNDEVIWEMALPSNFYRAEKLSLYTNNNLVLDKASKVGSLGKTKNIPKNISILLAYDKVPDEYQISLSKESDRLILNGTFEKHSEVYLILDGIFDHRVYQIFVSEIPYTAMCIDIFNNKEELDNKKLKLNYYINDEGLKGTYDIYLKINDKTYATKKYAVFN